MEREQLGQLFEACDLDGSGYIDPDELTRICPDMSPQEINEIFDELDTDGDGQVTISEFENGFNNIAQRKRRESIGQPLPDLEDERDLMEQDDGESEVDMQHFVVSLDEGFQTLSCQEQVCTLYQQLHETDKPQVVAQFEDVLVNVIKDMRKLQHDNERLEKSYKREKEQHTRHLRQLEEEMENQMQKVEFRVRREENERGEQERQDLTQKLETEMADLHENLKRLQRLEKLQKGNGEDVKSRMDDFQQENRFLKTNLTDAQTNLALLKSELTTTRHEYDEKCYELTNEKDSLVSMVKESDCLGRQLHMLLDANKKMHDTNDDLRSALDRARQVYGRQLSGSNACRCRRDSIMRSLRISRSPSIQSKEDYVENYVRAPPLGRPLSTGSSLADELGLNVVGEPTRKLLPAQDSCEVDSLPEDFDSGHSTFRNGDDFDSEFDGSSVYADRFSPRPKRNRMEVDFDTTMDSELMEDDREGNSSPDEDEAFPSILDPAIHLEGSVINQDDESLVGRSIHHSRSPSGGSCLSRASSRASRASRCSSRASSVHSQGSSKRSSLGCTIRRKIPTPIPKPITQNPERMFKIVLAGDAAVGKSSFIMRLCKGRFMNNLTSTLGVDFQTKLIEVDGHVVALQLWDTAGQERFRSIAKSYFRRADGVLLLYDVGYEKSFLSVREWVEAVEDGAQKKIPIMIVGNKTDLRDDAEKREAKPDHRFITYEDGHRLARGHEALFAESSAKDGHYVLDAVTELARLLQATEDLEVTTAGMQLSDVEVKKETSCCAYN